jgi:hypothetical protein
MPDPGGRLLPFKAHIIYGVVITEQTCAHLSPADVEALQLIWQAHRPSPPVRFVGMVIDSYNCVQHVAARNLLLKLEQAVAHVALHGLALDAAVAAQLTRLSTAGRLLVMADAVAGPALHVLHSSL